MRYPFAAIILIVFVIAGVMLMTPHFITGTSSFDTNISIALPYSVLGIGVVLIVILLFGGSHD